MLLVRFEARVAVRKEIESGVILAGGACVMIVGAARHRNGGHAKNRGWKSPDYAAHRRPLLRFGFTSRRQQLPTIASSLSTQLQSLHAPASKNPYLLPVLLGF